MCNLIRLFGSGLAERGNFRIASQEADGLIRGRSVKLFAGRQKRMYYRGDMTFRRSAQ
jgi:hypothetical protein